jgi:hypothetical protein
MSARPGFRTRRAHLPEVASARHVLNVLTYCAVPAQAGSPVRDSALSYAGFSFPVPGSPEPVATLFVSEDGAITTRTSGDDTGVDDNGSPWYMRGQLLLTNRLTIGALMKVLDSTAAAPGILGTIGIASGTTRAADLGKVKPIDFAALRDGAPVVLPFANGGAVAAARTLDLGAESARFPIEH